MRKQIYCCQNQLRSRSSDVLFKRLSTNILSLAYCSAFFFFFNKGVSPLLFEHYIWLIILFRGQLKWNGEFQARPTVASNVDNFLVDHLQYSVNCKCKLNAGLVKSRDLGNKVEVTCHSVGTEESPTHAVSIADH